MNWPSESRGVTFALTAAIEETELDLKSSEVLVMVGLGFLSIQVFSSMDCCFLLTWHTKALAVCLHPPRYTNWIFLSFDLHNARPVNFITKIFQSWLVKSFLVFQRIIFQITLVLHLLH